MYTSCHPSFEGNNRFLSYTSAPQNAEGEDAELYKEVEGLQKPKVVDETQDMEALLKKADEIWTMTDEQLIDDYSDLDENSTLVELLNKRLDVDAELNIQIDALGQKDYKDELDKMRRKDNPKVETILDEALEFYSQSSNAIAFGSNDERLAVLDNVKSFGLGYHEYQRDKNGEIVLDASGKPTPLLDSAGNPVEGDLSRKATILGELRTQEKAHRNKENKINRALRAKQVLNNDEKTIDKEHLEAVQKRKDLFKKLGKAALVIGGIGALASGAALWGGLPLATLSAGYGYVGSGIAGGGLTVASAFTGTGIGHLLGGVSLLAGSAGTVGFGITPYGATGYKKLMLKKDRFSLWMKDNSAQDIKEKAVMDLNKKQLKQQLGEFEAQEKENRTVLEADLVDLEKDQSLTKNQIQEMRRQIQLLDPQGTDRNNSSTPAGALFVKLQELIEKNNTQTKAIDHMKKVIAMFDISEKEKDFLSSPDALNAVLTNKYFPGTNAVLKELVQKKKKEVQKSQVEFGKLDPREIHKSITTLNEEQRDAYCSFTASEVKDEGNPEPNMAKIDILKKDHPELYNLCQQMAHLNKDNPFRKKAGEALDKELASEESKRLAITTRINAFISNFSTHFNENFISEDGLFEEGGLVSLLEKEAKKEKGLLKAFKDVPKGDMDAAKVQEVAESLSLHDVEALAAVLESLITDPADDEDKPKYSIDEKGKISTTKGSEKASKKKTLKAFTTLPKDKKKALSNNLDQIRSMELTGISDAEVQSLPSGVLAVDFNDYVDQCSSNQLQVLTKLLTIFKRRGKIDSSGNLLDVAATMDNQVKEEMEKISLLPNTEGLQGSIDMICKHPNRLEEARKYLNITQGFSAAFKATVAPTSYASPKALISAVASLEDKNLLLRVLKAIPGKLVLTPMDLATEASIRTEQSREDGHFLSIEHAKRDIQQDMQTFLRAAGTDDFAKISVIPNNSRTNIRPAFSNVTCGPDGIVKLNGKPLDHQDNRRALPYLLQSLDVLETNLKDGDMSTPQSLEKDSTSPPTAITFNRVDTVGGLIFRADGNKVNG